LKTTSRLLKEGRDVVRFWRMKVGLMLLI